MIASNDLKKHGISSSRLDTLILIENVIGKDRSWILANLNDEIDSKNIKKINKLLKLRQSHIPIAYIINKVEFYNHIFFVNHDVLVPRPETETMIDIFKGIYHEEEKKLNKLFTDTHKLSVVDIGTGCGAIGISTYLEVPNINIDLIDNDPKALKVAKINVDKLTPGLNLYLSNLLENVNNNYDVILANLPYVSDTLDINVDAKHEPKQAIFASDNGLSLYQKLFKQINKLDYQPLYILIEAFPSQHTEITNLAMNIGYKPQFIKDFIIAFKYISNK
jgi:release factor glutamine methyltransferase